MQCAGRINSSHFKEISPFVKYNYEYFCFECVKLFDFPDLTQTYLTELADLAQGRDEDYESYQDRVRDLVSKSHPELTGDARERLMSSYFTRGLDDDRVRDVVSATPGISSQEALRRASAMASSRCKGVSGGPPPRRLPKEQFKDSASSFSSYASQGARGVHLDADSYYQSVKKSESRPRSRPRV